MSNYSNKNSFANHDKWKETIINENSSIADVLKNLNKSGLRISLIVNNENKFQGTISDGDIRRALIYGKDQKDSIKGIINRNALFVMPNIKSEIVLQLMIKNKLPQIPIVDENKKISGLFLWDEFLEQKKISNTIVIMAGGKGSRLGKYTKNCPKALLPINGKPMLLRIIEKAKLQGFEKFIISVNYLGHMIEDYFSDGQKWDVNINYLRENSPLGTAGSLNLISKKSTLPYIVTNCDIVSDFNFGDLLDFHNHNKAEATMAVRIHEWENPYGVVRTKGVDIIEFEEKPVIKSHINAGVYVLENTALDYIKKNEFLDMPVLFERLKKKKLKTIVYPIHEPWLDIGRPEDYFKAR